MPCTVQWLVHQPICVLKALQWSWLNAPPAISPLTKDHAHITKVLSPSELILPEKYNIYTAALKPVRKAGKEGCKR